VTVCFPSASAANCWVARSFLRGPSRWMSLGTILPTGLVAGYSATAG